MWKEEKPIPAEDIAVREMLRNHEHVFSSELGEINITEMRIDLIPDAKQFKSPPLRPGPKPSELERAENKKQLQAGLIEQVISEWAAPVLFFPKEDSKLHFCIDCRNLS